MDLFKDYGKVFIRTPLYSYLSLFDENGTKNLDDLVRLRLHDPVFMEALYWSSPQLFESVLRFKEGVLKVAKEKKLFHTLKKYLIRASTRCTPYGIYAGIGIADIGLMQENQNHVMERKVRIDMGLLQTLKCAIESDPAIYPHLLYSVNNSLYSIPGQYRFMETIIENGTCHYQLSSLEYSDFLEQIVQLSKNKMVCVDDIYALAERDTPKEEFDDFINELIRSQFLVSELRIGLTGGDEVERFMAVLKRLTQKGVKEAQKYLRLFSSIEGILIQFEKSAIGHLPLEEIKDLKLLLDECEIAPTDHLFHADLKQSITGAVFSKEKLKEIEHAIIALGKLGCNPTSSQMEVDRFKKLFTEKYETREIPLSEALDPEFGIGFPAKERIGDAGFNSLLEKFDTGYENNQKQADQNCQTWLQDKREASTRFLFNESIEIKDEDLKDFEDKSANLPSTFSVMGSLLPGGQILLETIGGTHANSLLGRFAYLDHEMMNVCKEVCFTEREADKRVIFAEIIFIPEGRIGNIARRPVFSDYEIPLLAGAATQEKQIPVNDLMVSIQDDEIILRSKKLDQRVIPRLSNAHNYSKSLVPAYRFLCAIQQQGRSGLGINLGDTASKKRFLPRMFYKNLIFYRACWFLYKNDIKAIVSSRDPLTELRAYFLRWNVTRFVCFTEADNELLIDTNNESYLELLLEEIKCHDRIKLVEWLYDTDFDVPVQQFILPLSQKIAGVFKQLSKPEAAKNIPRTFVPGSEWIYFKIYCGSTVSDKILMNVVKPTIDSLLEKCMIKKAFFIRFTDPHYHIRFRLHVNDRGDTGYLAAVLKYVYDLLHPFCEKGLVWKVQLDTYEREIERYGEHAIPASEAIFFHDTLLFLNCMQHQQFAEDEQIRFLAALKNIDKWLTLFEMSVEEKARYCKKMTDCFSEYKRDIKLQTDIKYRGFKNLLPDFFNSDKFDDEFSTRDEKIREILCKENLASYIHMSLNRLFINQQRLMEYMCYSFCSKYYQQLLHNQ
ncbi:MAG TPA: lantibiotic dehydratase [Hanamia sp.]|nr:lantibiotic dehydratase [Hanamia sp.]